MKIRNLSASCRPDLLDWTCAVLDTAHSREFPKLFFLVRRWIRFARKCVQNRSLRTRLLFTVVGLASSLCSKLTFGSERFEDIATIFIVLSRLERGVGRLFVDVLMVFHDFSFHHKQVSHRRTSSIMFRSPYEQLKTFFVRKNNTFCCQSVFTLCYIYLLVWPYVCRCSSYWYCETF